MIEMFDDWVEIFNFGGFLFVVVKDFGYKSMICNLLIFGLFICMYLVERVVFGIFCM